MFQVTNNIWIGEFATEDFRGVCRFFGITHILNVTELPSRLEMSEGPLKRIIQVPLRDEEQISTDVAIQCCQTLHEFVCELESSVYIHSESGLNRSPTIAWLYLVSCGIEFSTAYELIYAASEDSNPNNSKLISPALVDRLISYGRENFIPHPRPNAIEYDGAG